MKERSGKGGADKDIWYRTKKVHNKVYNQDSNHQTLGNYRTGKGTEKIQLVPKSGRNTKREIQVETYAQEAARRKAEGKVGPKVAPYKKAAPVKKVARTTTVKRGASTYKKAVGK